MESKHPATPVNQFESLRELSDKGEELWYARELQAVLDYGTWRKFEQVINKAVTACKTTGYSPENHFVHLDKMVEIGSGEKRKQTGYQLSGYACGNREGMIHG